MAGGINVFSELPGHTTHVDMEAIIDASDVIMFDGITLNSGTTIMTLKTNVQPTCNPSASVLDLIKCKPLKMTECSSLPANLQDR